MDEGKTINPREIDVRLAVGRPSGDNPIKILCPMHPDVNPSLCVYRGNLNCLGCGFHVSRRYASLAFLLGYWDGHGDENSGIVRQAVRRINLKNYVGRGIMKQATRNIPPLDPYAADSFHQYLLRYGPLGRLMRERGLTYATVCAYRLGYTGSHFTIPVYDMDGRLYTLKYRADDRLVDADGGDMHKYGGISGHNSSVLFSLPTLRGRTQIDELWISEGEFDCISSTQAGCVTLTATNGASSLCRIPDMVANDLPWLIVKRWVLATDQDEAGESAATKLAAILGACAWRARWGEIGRAHV